MPSLAEAGADRQRTREAGLAQRRYLCKRCFSHFANAEAGGGIMPHYELKVNGMDIKNGIDKQLLFTFNLLKERR